MAAKTKNSKPVKDFQALATESARNARSIVAKSNFQNNLTWRDIVPSITVRNTSTEDSYYQFRQAEQLPTTPKGIIAMGMSYYKRNPIVKNTFDTMAEFSANGMVVPHRNQIIQNFYEVWLKKVGSYQLNEQFVRLLFKCGVVPVHRTFTKVSKAVLADMKVGLAENEPFPKIEFVKSEIPISYSFLNPLSITLPQENLSLFLGKMNYFVSMPEELIKIVKGMTKKQLEEFIKEFPPRIANSLRKGETDIPIDPKETTIFHYKKDDFEAWGEPVHACIFDDLIHFDKVKMADRTTLDSIASRIRLWKLGHLDKEYSIFPDNEAFEKLNDIVASNPPGGVIDLVWGPDINVEELSKDAHLFLSPEKYKAPLNGIYQGLGVPRTVNDDNGFNNNYFGLKTMVERLNYARNVLKGFWDEEFKKIHLAMGFTGKPPATYFDEISITNKEQMLALVRDLADRNIISDQEVRRLFNTDPEIEASRVKKQHTKQKNGTIPPKTGPFTTDANLDSDLKKIALTKGFIKPQDVDIETSVPDKDIRKIAIPVPKTPFGSKAKGQPKKGRPRNSADKSGRKKRTVKPRSSMANIWYTSAQSKLRELITNQYLEKFGKKNYRQLSTASCESLEKEAFAALYSIEYGADLDKLDTFGVNTILSEDVSDKYNALVARFVKEFGRTPNIDEQRILQVEICLDK